MKNLTLFTLIMFLLTGCFVTIPRTFYTPQGAFPGGSAEDNMSTGNVAVRQSIMNFSYADVFASSEKALSFAQINVVESNETSGIIYGTRSALVKGYTKKFYYMLKVKEEGAERCTVYVYSKQQQSGKYIKWLGSVILPTAGVAALSIALLPDDPAGAAVAGACVGVVLSPIAAVMNISAKKNAALKWSPDDDEYLDRIMSFIRTDLLQQ